MVQVCFVSVRVAVFTVSMRVAELLMSPTWEPVQAALKTAQEPPTSGVRGLRFAHAQQCVFAV